MKNRGGFTIVETLITLAVSSALFVTIMTAFSGRQGRVEFAQGVRDIESHLQDVANDVSNGYYPSGSNRQCSVLNGSLDFSAVTASTQGTSNACVFAGKAIFFNKNTTPGKVVSYSLAGDKLASSLATLKQAIIINAAGSEVSEEYTIPANITLINGSGTPISALIGLFFDLGSVSAGSKGATSVSPYIITISSSDLAGVKAGLANAFAAPPNATAAAVGSSGVKLCFNGANNQKAIITIQKGIDGLNTSVLIDQKIDATTGCMAGV